MPISLSGSLVLTGSLTATSSITTPVVNSPLLQNGSQYIIQDTVTQITAIQNGSQTWGFYPGGQFYPAGVIGGSSYGSNQLNVTNLGPVQLKGTLYGAQIVTSPDLEATYSYAWNFKTDGDLELPTGKSITGSLFGTASYALTASSADAFTVRNTLTAQTLVVQIITSSVDFVTGSTRFGSSLSTSTHQFTGSVSITGSLAVVTTGTEFQVNSTGVNLGNALTDSHVISGSLRVNPSGLFVSSSGNVGIGTTSPSQKLEVVGGEIKAGRVDTNQEGGQVSFGRASDNNTTWYIDAYGSSTSPQLRFVDVDNSAVRMVLTGSNVGIGTTSPSSLLDLSIGNNQKIFNMKGATTGYQYMQMSNTSGSLLIGIEGSTPNNIATGDLAYSSVISTANTSALQFGVNQAVSMTLVNGGNVGIGTSSPRVAGGGYVGMEIYGASGASLLLSNGGGNITYLYNAASGGDFQIENAGAQVFRAGSSERMRITSAGVIQLGNTNYSPYLQFRTGGGTTYAGVINMDTKNDYLLLNGGNSTGYGSGASITLVGSDRYGTATAGQLELSGGSAANNTSQGFIAFYTANTLRMQISFNGAIGTTAGGTNIYNPSDLRLKKNITEISYGLNEIIALKPSKFNWRDGFSESEADKDMLGFIAQEIQTIIPEAVESFGQTVTVKTENHDYSVENPLRVNEKFIIPVLVKAIQELEARLKTLENK